MRTLILTLAVSMLLPIITDLPARLFTRELQSPTTARENVQVLTDSTTHGEDLQRQFAETTERASDAQSSQDNLQSFDDTDQVPKLNPDLTDSPQRAASSATSLTTERSTTPGVNTPSPAPDPVTGARVLSPRVLAVLSETQRWMEEGLWEEALNEMNALYTEMDNLSSFEQSTLLNFYTNALLAQEMYEEAIIAFTRILETPDVPENELGRTILSLGQLHMAGGNNASAIYYFETWLANVDRSTVEPERVARIEERLAYLLQNQN